MTKEQRERQLYYEFSTNGITIPSFTWEHLKLNAIECIIYGTIYSYGTINYTLDSWCRLTGITSDKTMAKYLDRLVKEDLIRKRNVSIMSNRKRSIYTCCFDRNGRISNNTINERLDKATEDLLNHYRVLNPIRMDILRGKKNNKKS